MVMSQKFSKDNMQFTELSGWMDYECKNKAEPCYPDSLYVQSLRIQKKYTETPQKRLFRKHQQR